MAILTSMEDTKVTALKISPAGQAERQVQRQLKINKIRNRKNVGRTGLNEIYSQWRLRRQSKLLCARTLQLVRGFVSPQFLEIEVACLHLYDSQDPPSQYIRPR